MYLFRPSLKRRLLLRKKHDYAVRQQQAAGNKTQEGASCSLLRSCRSLEAAHKIHAWIIRAGIASSPLIGDVLVQVYGKYGRLEKLRFVFDSLQRRTALSWTVIIAAYARNRHYREALDLFKSLDIDIRPDRYMYLNVLAVCSELKAMKEGRRLHEHMAITGVLCFDVHVQNALINMYAKCGEIARAEALFFNTMLDKDIVSWNSMISAYAQNGRRESALGLYQRMVFQGVMPDEYTLSTVISACCNYEHGKAIHWHVTSAGTHSNNIPIQNALINMYLRCGSLEEAKLVFDKMERRNVISWTAMIAAYTQQGQGKEAVVLFRKMDLEGAPQPNNVTFAAVITACSNEGMLAVGRTIHSRISNPDSILQNTLLNLYGKCGAVEEARRVFETIKVRSVVTWTTMVAAYAHKGYFMEALDLSREMELNGVLPNSITFGCILMACSYGGMVEQAWSCLSSMAVDYGVKPEAEHYVCMVDLLGRAGQVFEAEDLMSYVPREREELGWMALLGACRNQEDAERGTRAAQLAFDRCHNNALSSSGLMVLLSHVCTSST